MLLFLFYVGVNANGSGSWHTLPLMCLILNMHDVFTSDIFFFILPSFETKTFCSALLSSLAHRPPSMSDLACTSRFAVSIRREGKAKRHQPTAITPPTTSRPTSQKPRSFGHVTSSSCCERTSESSFPALRLPYTENDSVVPTPPEAKWYFLTTCKIQ